MNAKAYFRAQLLMVLGGLFVLTALSGILITAYLHRHRPPSRPHVHVNPETGITSVVGIVDLPTQALCGVVYPHVHRIEDANIRYQDTPTKTTPVVIVDMHHKVHTIEQLPPIPICTNNKCYVR